MRKPGGRESERKGLAQSDVYALNLRPVVFLFLLLPLFSFFVVEDVAVLPSRQI
jgi:hypothetical protein